MIRLNVVLLLALLASAFYLVNVRYESRRVYMALSKAEAQALRLDAEHDQWLSQKRTQAASVRVQQLGVARLQMRSTNPAVTEYVRWDAENAAPSAQP